MLNMRITDKGLLLIKHCIRTNRVVSEQVIVFPILFAGSLENPITPLSMEEFETKGTVPFTEIISSLLSR